MEPVALVAIALAAVFLLIFLHVPIGIAMALVGVTGFAALSGWTPALRLLSTEPASLLTNIDIAVIPLFLLMGSFANTSGIADDIYDFAAALVGHIRGGLALATIVGCGLFGSIAGSSVATTAAFGRIALPQMRARRYKAGMTAGSIAGGGTLGAMVPPSVVLVIYGLIAEQFILDLFVAAIVPAILAIAGYVIAIAIATRFDRDAAPPSQRASRQALLAATRRCSAAFLLFLSVSGGIYSGVFTVTEAASIGALLTAAIALLRRRLPRAALLGAMRETAANTAMIYVAIFGASILSYFIGLTKVSEDLVQLLQRLDLPPLAVIGLLVVMYLALGAVFDETAAMLVTLPFVLPVVTSMGYHPVWWGIINLVVINLGMIIPPIGLNVFVLHALAPDISLGTIYRGVLPFIIADLARLVLLIVAPGITLWLLAVLK
jgi:C4-dicarboxylate transporter, DctM subunit